MRGDGQTDRKTDREKGEKAASNHVECSDGEVRKGGECKFGPSSLSLSLLLNAMGNDGIDRDESRKCFTIGRHRSSFLFLFSYSRENYMEEGEEKDCLHLRHFLQ